MIRAPTYIPPHPFSRHIGHRPSTLFCSFTSLEALGSQNCCQGCRSCSNDVSFSQCAYHFMKRPKSSLKFSCRLYTNGISFPRSYKRYSTICILLLSCVKPIMTKYRILSNRNIPLLRNKKKCIKS